MLEYRKASPEEFTVLKNFIFAYGPNPWNYLPEDGVDNSFSLISNNQGEALVACDGEIAVGLALFFYPSALPENFQQYSISDPSVYVAEVVVHSDCAGRGIGTQLLKEIINRAIDLKARRVLLDRHEENAASAGMMAKAGFREICTFYDPERRLNGTRNTTVLEYSL